MIQAALEFGIRVVDTAIGGLGGCLFARGATGNVATEDVVRQLISPYSSFFHHTPLPVQFTFCNQFSFCSKVYMLNGLGMETGGDMDGTLM